MPRAKRKSDNPHVTTLAHLGSLFHMEAAATRVVLRRANVKPAELARSESGVLVREAYSTVDATAALAEYRKKWPHMTTDPEISAAVAAARAENFKNIAAKAAGAAPQQPQQQATIDESLVGSAVDTLPQPQPQPVAEVDLSAVVNTLAMIGEATELKTTELIGAVKSIEAAIGDLASELAKLRTSFDAWNTPGKC